jgi:general stress protein 26
MIHIASFSEIEEEFVRLAHAAVLCNGATVDSRNRPRSRVLHPWWEGATGWVTTRHSSPKVKHIAANPHVSLAYIVDPFRPIYVECTAEWIGHLDERQRIWEALRNMPAPFGFDPAETWGDIADPENGLLKLTPWRIELNDYVARPPVTKAWKTK